MLVMEKILRIPVAEIAAFRFVCVDCKAITEISLTQLPTAPLKCPGCNADCRRPNVDTAMKNLASSLTILTKDGNDKVELQFVVNMP